MQTETIPNDLLQWQPRVGLAWNPSAETGVRLSVGLFSAPTAATFFHRVSADNGMETIAADSDFAPEILADTGASSGSPHALSAPPAGLSPPAALVVGIDPHFRNADSLQAATTIDEILSPKLTLRSGVLHQSTWDLQREVDGNLYAPVIDATGMPISPSTRPIAGVGRLLINQSSAHSSYSSFNAAAISQISRRSQVTVNYTLSQSHDDDSTPDLYGIVSALDPFNVKDFTLKGEGHHLDLFMDFFNVLNHSNRDFGADQVSFFGAPSAPVFSAGRALFAPDVTRVGGPREVQFTARLVGF